MQLNIFCLLTSERQCYVYLNNFAIVQFSNTVFLYITIFKYLDYRLNYAFLHVFMKHKMLFKNEQRHSLFT